MDAIGIQGSGVFLRTSGIETAAAALETGPGGVVATGAPAKGSWTAPLELGSVTGAGGGATRGPAGLLPTGVAPEGVEPGGGALAVSEGDFS